MEQLKLVTKFAKTVDMSSGDNYQLLSEYDPYTRTGYRVISESVSIENLKAISYIKSFTPADFPVFELGTSESQRFFATLNIEWGSERCQMNLLLKIGDDYHKISMQSLLNPSPYPFREFDLGNFDLGSNSNLYAQIEDVGYGLLQASDSVVFHGELVRDIYIEKLVDTSIKIANSISNIPAIIVNSNPDRKGLTFFNSSAIDVFIDTVSSVSLSSYMIKLEPGDYYEAPSPIYTGNYYAITQSNSTAIDIREFV
ncbi:hypothetical protein WDZ92_06420 [Nostoc sp. NIES-2111]